MIIVRNLEDQYEDERLYSTGDDYLDEMLEKAFCDGYEYAQKEFATPPLKPGMAMKKAIMPLPKKPISQPVNPQRTSGVFNQRALQRGSQYLKSKSIQPTKGGMKGLFEREMQHNLNSGPSVSFTSGKMNPSGNAKRLSSFDNKVLRILR